MNNLEIYEKVRKVPKEAQRAIAGGRLKGKTDINPMWRIKTLTELFGPCGIGWKPEIVRTWLETGANGEIGAFVEIKLYVKVDGAWSDPIPGTGGSMFVTNEKDGLYTDDECYKKAYTDALSVACKALGIGADIYWDKDSSKYDQKGSPSPAEKPKAEKRGIALSELRDLGVEDVGAASKYLGKHYGKSIEDLNEEEREEALYFVKNRVKKKKEEREAAMKEAADIAPPWDEE